MNAEPSIQVRDPEPNYTCCRAATAPVWVRQRGRCGHLQSVSHLFTQCTTEASIIPGQLPLRVCLLSLTFPHWVLSYFHCHCVAFSQRSLTACGFPHSGWKHFLVFGGGGVCVGTGRTGNPVLVNSLPYKDLIFCNSPPSPKLIFFIHLPEAVVKVPITKGMVEGDVKRGK